MNSEELSRKRCEIHFISRNKLYWLFVVHGYTDEVISDKYGCSVSTVKRVRQRYGITRQSRKAFKSGDGKMPLIIPPYGTSRIKHILYLCRNYLVINGDEGKHSKFFRELYQLLIKESRRSYKKTLKKRK